MRELAEMAEGRLRAEWTQTAEVLAMVFNMNRAPDTKPIPAWRLNPFGKQESRHAQELPNEDAWSIFKGAFDRGAFGGARR